MPKPFDEVDYAAFQLKIQNWLGIRLMDYKEDQMRRRVGTMAQQAGCDSFVAYALQMQQSPPLLQAFLDQITINVTELMRNPSLFGDLAQSVLPELIAARRGLPLSVWSAGCSYGAEAITLAMLLRDAPGTPSYRIKGTDLDLSVLAKANAGMFSAADMASVPHELRQRHFISIDDNTFMPMPDLRRSVQFAKHDLLADPYPADTYDLILCRNVLIYFTDAAKQRIYQGFFQALRPDGVLFVGGTERIYGAESLGFELVKPFFYRAKKYTARQSQAA